MAHAVIRKDRMYGTDVAAALVSLRYVDGNNAAAPIDNGNVVKLVGLETGFIYAYRAGWTVSTAAIVQSAFLGVVLIFVGMLLYKEVVTPTKVAGILICLVGLYFINK